MVQLPAGQCSTPAYVAHVIRLRGCDPGRPRGGPERRRFALVGVCRRGVAVRIAGAVAAGRPDRSLAVFDEDLALAAYESGVFPMPTRPGLMGWYSPLDRAILPLDGLRISRSLHKSMKRYRGPHRYGVRRRFGRLR